MTVFRHLVIIIFTVFFLFLLNVCKDVPFPISSAYGEEAATAKQWEYTPGMGLRVGGTDFRLGGYINLHYSDAGGRKGSFLFDDLSLFVFGNINERTRFFSEWEDAHFLEVDIDGRVRSSYYGELERLYLDYLSSDSITIRIGKFLTPIGIWNEVHADPLTWTVSRPLVTMAGFPEYTTGIQFYGNLAFMDEDFEYAIFLQNNESINERTGFRKTHLIYGGRLRLRGESGLETGIPLVYYTEYYSGERVYLTGLDIFYKKRGIEVRGEAIYSRIDPRDGGNSKEYGYYLQGVYPLNDKIYLVLRQEYFRARLEAGDLKALSIGTTYRPRSHIAFKVEYQIRSGELRLRYKGEDIDKSDQFLASFSILF